MIKAMNVVVGKPLCAVEELYGDEDVYYTEERYLPALLVELGYMTSRSEVRRNRPDLVRTLTQPNFEEIRIGKKRLFLTTGAGDEKEIILLMGASGTGKTTLGEYLKELGVPELVSHTTRAPRVGEVDGVHYHFTSLEEINQLDMLETATYSGNTYGLSKEEVFGKLEAHDKVFAVLELSGVENMIKAFPSRVKVIFITTPIEIIEERMRSRGDSEEVIANRIYNVKAFGELLRGMNLCNKHITNIDLDKSKEELKKYLQL